MPEISRFFGIIISVYYKDHSPPHFHVKYGEYRGVIGLNHLDLIEGKLPARVIGLVLEWTFQHRDELREDWELAQSEKPLKKIAPLE